MELYVTRHGQTECNKKGITSGQADSPLTKQGVSDAEKVAESLRGNSFDKIFCSDLGRSIHTALIIKKSLNLDCDLVFTPELRETNYGKYNYTKRSEMRKHCPEYLKDFDFVYPEGESLADMHNRVIKFLQEIKQKETFRVLLVTHGGPIRAIMTHFNDIPKEEYQKEKISHTFVAKFVLEKDDVKEYRQILE